jgi:hypothetical protein
VRSKVLLFSIRLETTSTSTTLSIDALLFVFARVSDRWIGLTHAC